MKPAWTTSKWISAGDCESTPMPLFRRSFTLDRPVKRAVSFVCGLGQFELRVNGAKAGEDVMEPGWTNYAKTCLYVARDVTALLRNGENALGVMLGNLARTCTGCTARSHVARARCLGASSVHRSAELARTHRSRGAGAGRRLGWTP